MIIVIMSLKTGGRGYNAALAICRNGVLC
jgi:hypothetical protein